MKELTVEHVHIVFPRDGSSLKLRIVKAIALAVSAPLNEEQAGKDEDVKASVELLESIRSVCCDAAIHDDVLWRQCAAALSVGPNDFAEFMSKREDAGLNWMKKFNPLIDRLAEYAGVDRFYITIYGADRPWPDPFFGANVRLHFEWIDVSRKDAK